jgi:hypothetical protein
MAQADTSAGSTSAILRIDRLILHDAAHLELSVFDREGQSPLDKVERVLAELLESPAAQDI